MVKFAYYLKNDEICSIKHVTNEIISTDNDKKNNNNCTAVCPSSGMP